MYAACIQPGFPLTDEKMSTEYWYDCSVFFRNCETISAEIMFKVGDNFKLGSITSRCSGNEPVDRGPDSRKRRKSSLILSLRRNPFYS